MFILFGYCRISLPFALIAKVLLVEFTGQFFMVKGLTAEQWMWCLFLGFTELIWGQVVLSIPKSFLSSRLKLYKKGIPPKVVISPDASESSGRVLWLRGLTRLQYQVWSCLHTHSASENMEVMWPLLSLYFYLVREWQKMKRLSLVFISVHFKTLLKMWFALAFLHY